MKQVVRMITAGLALVSVLGLSGGVQAQGTTPALAALQDDNIVVMGAAPAVTIQTGSNKGILSLVWNPGGTKLAYIVYDEQFETHIAVVDASGSSAPVLLDAGKLEAGFPVNWTPDGQVLFVGAGDMSDMNRPYRVDLKRIAPEAGATAETIGSFDMMVGCGGGSMLPADWAYWNESGFGGNGLILQWTDYGILHSTTCSGGSMALYAPQGGQDTALTADTLLTPQPGTPQQQVGRAVLQGDGKTLAAIRSVYAEPGPIYSLVVIDLSTREVSEVKTQDQPDQLAWSPGGELFYSARKETGKLATNLTAEQQKNVDAVFGSPGFEVPHNEVSIHRLNLSSGTDTVIYTAPAYVIGRMASTIDGQALVFSQIANLDKWVEGIANGTLDVINDNDGKAQQAVVPVTLYWLPMNGSPAAALGEQLTQFQLKP